MPRLAPRWNTPWRRTLAGGALSVSLGLGVAALAQPPAPQPQPQAPAAGERDPKSPVAYVGGTMAITRQDLGEFLIERGGANKIDLLVNKIIIESEAKRRGITVTDTEMMAAFNADLEGMKVDKTKFVEEMLNKYGKSLYEWMEDVIRMKLLMNKLIEDKVQVSDAEVELLFEREFGEKVVMQMIVYSPESDFGSLTKVWNVIRTDASEFDREATKQFTPVLAARKGRTEPYGRHNVGTDKAVEAEAFRLRVGEVSAILKTQLGYLVLKCVEKIPPQANVDRAKVLPELRQKAYEEKLAAEMPKHFAELQKNANPKVIYDGPTKWKTAASVVRTPGEKNPLAAPGAPQVMPAGGVVPAGK